MASAIEITDSTILYKCPYCVGGRFTRLDGWDKAVKHIRKSHLAKDREAKYARGYKKDEHSIDLSQTGVSLFDEVY